MRPLAILRHKRSTRTARLAVAAGAASSVFVACYNYSSTVSLVANSTTEVRLSLTDLGSAELANQIGPRVESLDGLVQRATADTVVLAVTRTVARDGHETDWRGEPVAVATRQVATVRARRLSPGRTAIAAAIGVGALVGVLLASHGSSSTGGGSGPVPPGGTQ